MGVDDFSVPFIVLVSMLWWAVTVLELLLLV